MACLRHGENQPSQHKMISALSMLFVFHCVFFGVAALVIRRANRVPEDDTICRQCGYDVRSARSKCPECGTVDPQLDPAALERRAIRLQALGGLLLAIPISLDCPVLGLIYALSQ